MRKSSKKKSDCPAGNSEKCKHIIAVMLCLARMEEEELEDLTCTDIEQQWGTIKKSTLKDFEGKELSELCHVKGKRDVYVQSMPEVTKEMEENWKKKLMNCAALSEISIFTSCLRQGQGVACCDADEASQIAESRIIFKKLLTFRSWRALGIVRQWTLEKLATLTIELRNFYESHVAIKNLDQSLEIICIEQGTNAWHLARKFRMTASKAREQYTYLVNKKADWDARYKSLYHGTFKGNEHTIRGLEDEVPCRDKYEDEFSCKVFESELLVRPELCWLAASLDGTVLDPNNNLIRNIEIKSFKEGTRLNSTELLEMNAIPSLDKNGNVKKNDAHYAQMQLGMLVSGMTETDYLMWSRVDLSFAYKRVPFDEGYILDLCSRLLVVYFDKFLPRMMSEYAASDSSEED